MTLGLPRVAWVLTVSAFLCGGMISAAVFSVGWRHEAQRGSSAQTALAAETARAHALTTELAAARVALASSHAQTRQLRASQHELSASLAKLRTQVASARHSLATTSAEAAPLSGDLGRLTSELHALRSYVTSTPSGQLDAGYLQAQVAYLSKTANGLSAALAALAAPRN